MSIHLVWWSIVDHATTVSAGIWAVWSGTIRVDNMCPQGRGRKEMPGKAKNCPMLVGKLSTDVATRVWHRQHVGQKCHGKTCADLRICGIWWNSHREMERKVQHRRKWGQGGKCRSFLESFRHADMEWCDGCNHLMQRAVVFRLEQGFQREQQSCKSKKGVQDWVRQRDELWDYAAMEK